MLSCEELNLDQRLGSPQFYIHPVRYYPLGGNRTPIPGLEVRRSIH